MPRSVLSYQGPNKFLVAIMSPTPKKPTKSRKTSPKKTTNISKAKPKKSTKNYKMSSKTPKKTYNPLYNSVKPIPITRVTSAGKIRCPLNLIVEKRHRPEGGKDRVEFICSNGNAKKIKALAVGTNQNEIFEMLKEGHSYTIKGEISAKPKDRKYNSESTSSLDLFFWKISISETETVDSAYCGPNPKSSKSIKTKQTCSETGILVVRKKLESGRQFACELKNVIIVGGELYRYIGCEVCTKRVQCKNGKYICPSPKCIKKMGETTPKICMLIKCLRVKDEAGVVLDAIVCFDTACEKFIGKNGNEFGHDNEAREAFEQFFGSTVNIELFAKTNTYAIVAKNISVLKKRSLAGDGPSQDSVSFGQQVSSVTGPDTDPGDNPTSDDAHAIPNAMVKYEMNSKPPGLVLIINNIDFSSESSRRDGSEVDVQKLQTMFKKLGFKIFSEGPGTLNVTSKSLFRILERFKTELLEQNMDSCFVVVMSHGKCNEIEMADGKMKNLYTEIVYKFSESLFGGFNGKPKIFIFQSCQDFTLDRTKQLEQPELPEPELSPTRFMDILVCLPALPGYPAYRDIVDGSIYIAHLVQVFSNYAGTMHIVKMLDLVQHQMTRSTFLTNQQCYSYGICFGEFLFKMPTADSHENGNGTNGVQFESAHNNHNVENGNGFL